MTTQLDLAREALEAIAAHDHPDPCDGICADNLIDLAKEALNDLHQAEQIGAVR